jgi:calnexin
MRSSSRVSETGTVSTQQYANCFVDGLECGGAYMKLLQDNKALHAEEFSNASPYIIMFGPDKCGATNKV